MEATERERRDRLLAGIHAALLTALIVFRPLVWDGDAASPANLVYLALTVLALLVVAVEVACGIRPQLRWSWLGVVFVGFVLLLIPAAVRAPATLAGATWWWQLVLHLGLGAYLLQVVPGRERLTWTALVTAVVGELLIGWVQGLYVLPVMAASTAAGDIGAAAEGISGSDLGERIANGGWFGTFTLSNSLAAWLLVAAVPLIASIRRPWSAASWLGVSLLVAAVGLFLATKSKGALLALLVMGAIWWWRQIPDRRWRWLPLPAVLLGVALIWFVPAIQTGLQASARVRLGYWQGAWSLLGESPWTGLGWGAFAERASAVLPVWAEPSRLVHNEILELAVVAGIPLALALGALLIAIAWPRRDDALPRSADDRIPLSAAGTIVGLGAYLGLLGMLNGNVGWWPGGGTIIGQLAWSLVISVVLGVVLLTLRLPFPPGWCFRLALAALSLHCLIDFNLHSFAVIGTLLVVAVLAGGRRQEIACGRLVGLSLVVLTLSLGYGALQWAAAALTQRGLQDEIRELRLVGDPAHAQDALAAIAYGRGEPPPNPGDRAAIQRLVAATITDLNARAAAEPEIALQLCALSPLSPERAARLDALRVALPFNSTVSRLRADEYVHVGDYPAAVSEMRRALSLAPASQPLRQQLVRILERAARQDPAHAERWQDERAAVEAERQRLEPLVDFRNRSLR